MRYLTVIIPLLFSLDSLAFRNSSPVAAFDSVGHKWVNGKLFVMHKVEAGQTLYAVSRRYGASVDAIKAANNGASQLNANSVVLVPYSRFKKKDAKATSVDKKTEVTVPKTTDGIPTPVPNAEAPAAVASSAPSTTGLHTVAVGQTLYSIATKYSISVNDLKTWNKLESNNISLGQNLIVSKSRFTEGTEAPKVSVTNQASPETAKAAEANIVKPVTAEPVQPKEVVTKVVKQKGLAEKIDSKSGGSNKYLALHRSAPIGALIQVKNEVNQESIWVKVIGRIPDTSLNDEIVIKLSGSAFNKISPDTRRFRAEVVYNELVKE